MGRAVPNWYKYISGIPAGRICLDLLPGIKSISPIFPFFSFYNKTLPVWQGKSGVVEKCRLLVLIQTWLSTSHRYYKKKADLDWSKLQKDKKYRTPIKQLQHFTACNLEWKINKKSFPDFDAGKISLLVSDAINQIFDGDR